jgi:transposase
MKQITNARPILRYVALDIHREYVMVGGMNSKQEWVLRPRRVEMERFRTWAAANLCEGDAVVLEATTNVWDIYDIVAPLVSRAVVAHAAAVRQIAEARVKTDKQDIERLLRLLIADIVPEVWVPAVPVRELRGLISYRWRLVKMSTMIQNRLHSLLHRHNIQAPEGGLNTDKNQAWWEQQKFSPVEALQVKQELATLAQIEQHKEEIEQELGRLSLTEPWASQSAYLMQLSGVGVVITMTVLAAIGDISRFESPKKLVGYAGLGAGVHDSGKEHRDKKITKSGRKELRWAMVEAAWRAVRSNSYWKKQFETLKRRKHPNQAIVMIARKLLVTVWYVLSRQEAFRHASEEDLAYKMLIWSWSLNEDARQGMTPQQFAKYGLLRLGIGRDLTRIVKGGYPRRLAPAEEVLAIRPELRPPE